MNTELLPISKVFPNIGQVEGLPKNPRFIRDEKYKKLLQSIKDDPEMLDLRELIVYDTGNENGYVVAGGNMRYRAMKELGYKDVPCKVLHTGFPMEKLRRIVLKDNSSFGETDFKALVDEWSLDEIDMAAIDLPDLSLDDEEEETEDADDRNQNESEENDEIPVTFEEPESKPMYEENNAEEDEDFEENDVAESEVVSEGDIWQLGRHLLLCGDSTKEEDVQRLFPIGEQADLWLTDPPYNVGYGYEGSVRNSRMERKDGLVVLNDKQDNEHFLMFLTDAFTQAKNILKLGSTYYIFHSDSFSYYFRQALINIGDMELRQNLIWNKNSMVLGRQDYQWKHEPILTGWREGASHHWYGDRKQTTVIDWDRPTKSVQHPCLDPSTLVMTMSGYKPIGEIKKGEKVLASDGRFHNVEFISRHPYNEPIFNIKADGSNIYDRATHNHPYLIARRKKDGSFDVGFMEADRLKVGDYLMTPQVVQGTESPVTELDAWCYGLWLAQGSIQKAGHGDNEYPVFSIDSRKRILEQKLYQWGGEKAKTYPNGSGNGIKVIVFDNDKAKACIKLCGKYAENKTISEEVFTWSEGLRVAFFEGYMAGDGCIISTRGHRHSKSVSIELASQIRYIAESLGYRTSFYRRAPKEGTGIGGRKFKTMRTYYATDYRKAEGNKIREPFEYKGVKYILRRVAEIKPEPYNADVVNLSVEGNHTFQTVNGSTHNTMKPVGLVGYLMKNSSKPGDVVYDGFGGSGTTLVAAEQLDRTCRMVELSPHYCKVIIWRYIQLVGKYDEVFRVNSDGTKTPISEIVAVDELNGLCKN